MVTTGAISGLEYNALSRRAELHLSVDGQDMDALASLKGKALDITIKEHREKRSLNANALLWQCLGQMAEALRADKWDVYRTMIKRYGQYTYAVVRPEAVEVFKSKWRETEELGPVSVEGRVGVQLLCYYGSSTYDRREFAVLLDGVFSEMRKMGLSLPLRSDVNAALEAWEKDGRISNTEQ